MRQSNSVLLIYTGGTIGMNKTNEGSLKPFDLDTLCTQIPELNTFDIDINAISIAQPIDSSNMSKKVWIQLAEIIEKEQKKQIIETIWLSDAEKELKKIPFFVRGKAKKNTEAYASSKGISQISVETLYEAKAYYAN